ncbi:hypothetical protein ABZ917_13800 [Nonomuraea wenchangensis]
MYLNGAEVGSAQIGFPAWNANGAMRLGANMVGDLDNVLVYQSALSAGQIAGVHAGTGTPRHARKASAVAAKRFQYGHITTDQC